MIEILGYPDRLAVRPGEAIAFHVSCEAGAERYDAAVIRLVCGDDRPDGPGVKEHPVAAAINGSYPGRRQPIDCGSYARVEAAPALDVASFTLAALIFPTLPGEREETVAGRWHGDAEGGSGFALVLDAQGHPALRLGAGGRVWRLAHAEAVTPRRWYRVLASVDAASRAATIHLEPVEAAWGDPAFAPRTAIAPFAAAVPPGTPLTFAAHLADAPGRPGFGAGHYNGRIEAPRLVGAAVAPGLLDRLLATPLADPFRADLVAAWDFARDIASLTIRDIGPNRLDGRCVNLPTRGVRGPGWTGDVTSWREAPERYGAIHFHEDDLYDCRWEEAFTWVIPEGLPSGIYALRLTCGAAGEDTVPFFVLPPKGTAGAEVAFLASTATYLAYANSHDAYDDPLAERAHGTVSVLAPSDLFLMVRRDYGLSVYDHHRDGSGSCYTSRLRPILNMRPKRALWSLNADLHITDWLEASGIAYDVIDDETLDREGLALLKPYRCVITGAHPEYTSAAMMQALLAYTRGGGRLMYLGGNGFYWRVAWHPEAPAAMEIRRGVTGSIWLAEAGETHLAATGEPSGQWRNSGFAPQRLAGVGFISEGFDIGSYYRRQPASRDPRAAFVFAGVEGEIIGDYGVFGGAAALELDIVNPVVGTPANALVLASSEGHSNIYVHAAGEGGGNFPGHDGIECPDIRADMVFFETAGGGAVFSTGSIGWAGSLAHAGYDNDVSRITRNVVARFVDPEPFAPGR